MKKIFLALFLLVPCSFAFAQNAASSPRGIVVANVDILNPQIISQKDRTFNLSFYLSNGTGAQPQIKYAVELLSGQSVIDTDVYPEVLSLGSNQTLQKSISYTVPDSVPAGSYHLWIFSENNNGLMFALSDLGAVTIKPSMQAYVQIVPSSCYFTALGDTNHYTNGAALSATSTLTTHCSVTSTFTNTVALSPIFQTKINSAFGMNVQTSSATSASTIVLPGTHTMTFAMPIAQKPGAYAVVFSLAEKNNTVPSNSVSFSYSISGISGTIQNIVFDKSYYTAGDIAHLQIFALVSAPTSTIAINIQNSSGVSCAPEEIESIASVVSVIAVPITKNCISPKATLVLSAGGTILDSQNYSITSSAQEIANSASQQNHASAYILIIVLILITLAFIIFSFYFFKKNREKKIISVFGTLLLIGLFALTGNVAHATVTVYSYPTGVTGGCCGYNLDATFTYTTPGVVVPGTTAIPVSVSIASQLGFSLYWPAFMDSVVQGVDAVGVNHLMTYCYEVGGPNYLHPDTQNTSASCSGQSGSYTVSTVPLTSGTHSILASNLYLNSDDTGKEGDWYFDGNNEIQLPSDNSWNLPDTLEEGGTLVNNSLNPVSIPFTVGNPTAAFTSPAVSPYSINSNTATNLAWTAVNVDSCSLDGDTAGGEAAPIPWTYFSSFGTFGIGNEADLNNPKDVAVSSSGNIYVSDTGNNRVGVFNASGVFLFSFGSAGSGNGQFNDPTGITLDSSGNIYVADTGNNRVEEFNSQGNYLSSVINSSSNSGFESPQFLAMNGNIIFLTAIAPLAGSTTEEFTSNALTPIPSTKVTNPLGIAYYYDNNDAPALYVSDYSNQAIAKFSGTLTRDVWDYTYTGETGGISGGPTGIAAYGSGPTFNLYVSDSDANQIMMFTGNVDTLPGSGGGFGSTVPTFGSGTLNNPQGLAMDSSGNLYVADAGKGNIVKYNPAPNTTTVPTLNFSFGMNGVPANGDLNNPNGIVQDSSGNFYIADSANNRVEEFTSTGVYVNQFGSFGNSNGQLNDPIGVALDGAGDIFVTDSGNSRVEEFTTSGTYEATFGTGQLNDPSGIAYQNGVIYVTDSVLDTVYGFAVSSGSVVFESVATLRSRDVGDRNLVQPFNDPTGIALDLSGNIYVANTGDQVVDELSPSTGLITQTFSGSGSTALNAPAGVTVDSLGDIFVTDSGNNDVEEFDINGDVSTFGNSGSETLLTPAGIIMDGSGNIDVVDSGNNRIVTFYQNIPITSDITGSLETNPLTSDTTFNLSCTGPYGNASASTEITINPNSCNGNDIYNSTTGQCLPEPSCPGSIYNPTTKECCSPNDNEVDGGVCEVVSDLCSNPLANNYGQALPCILNTPPILPSGGGACNIIASQIGSTNNNIYVDKSMQWNVQSLPTGITASSVTWNGSNLLQTLTNLGTLNTIYTKIGSTTISASVLGSDGNTYTCSTSTVIRAGTATVENI